MDFTDSHGNVVALPEGTGVSWRISGYGLVKRDDGAYLMVQSGNGLWIFPGGGVEQTETITEAVIRECLEETGYSVSIGDDRPYFLREQKFYHTREQAFYHSVQIFYTVILSAADADTSMMTEHDKSRQVAWMPLDKLTDDTTHPTIAELVKKLRS